MKTIKSFLSVLTSNITTLVSGILVGIIVPIILSVDDYGYYKTFTLYVTYLGLFSLGVIDGIVLKYGGYDYQELDRSLFRSFFRWYLIIHSFIAIILMSFYPLLLEVYQRRILLLLILNMFALNITGYFRQISEITQRFKEYSIIKIVQSSLTIISVFAVLFLVKTTNVYVDYTLYIILVVCINVLIAAWYVLLYKDIVFGKSETLHNTFHKVIHLMTSGIPLMLANLCSTFILTIDRQFVNILFDNKTYAIYAFAYNLLALLTVATTAVSTVLYPSLKRSSLKKAMEKYSFFVPSSLIILYSILIFYFPLTILIKLILPKYVDSIIIFRIIFPGLPISSTITVIMHNYYKILGESSRYFKRSIIILAISIIANSIAYLLFRNTASISIASIITILIWFIYINSFVSNKLGLRVTKDTVYSILATAVFYISSTIDQWAVGAIAYLLCFLLLTFLVQKETLQNMKNLFHKE